ncbi:MAG: hypothetical protein V1928_04510 [Parcubacteria group bacterium]
MADIDQQKKWRRESRIQKSGKTPQNPAAKAMNLDPQKSAGKADEQQTKRDLNQAKNQSAMDNRANQINQQSAASEEGNKSSSPLGGSGGGDKAGISNPEAALKKAAMPPQMKAAKAISSKLEPMIGKKMAKALEVVLIFFFTFGCGSCCVVLALLPYIFAAFIIGKTFGYF